MGSAPRRLGEVGRILSVGRPASGSGRGLYASPVSIIVLRAVLREVRAPLSRLRERMARMLPVSSIRSSAGIQVPPCPVRVAFIRA